MSKLYALYAANARQSVKAKSLGPMDFITYRRNH